MNKYNIAGLNSDRERCKMLGLILFCQFSLSLNKFFKPPFTRKSIYFFLNCEGGELNPHRLPHWILSPKVLLFNLRFSPVLTPRKLLRDKEINCLTRVLYFQPKNAIFSCYCHPTATHFHSLFPS